MTRSLRRLLEKMLGSGTLLQQIATVLSGTATAQVLTLGAMVFLARLYTPADFGLYAIFQSVVSVGVTVAALRYDVAVMLPRSNLAARALHRLASRSIMVSSVALSIVLLIAYPLVHRFYGNEVFATGLVAAGLAVYLVAQVANLQFWLIRQQRYRTIAGNRLVQAVAVAGFQILFALIIGGLQALLAGLLAGQVVTLIWGYRRAPELRCDLPSDAPTLRQVARRYRKMPLVNGPHALLDAGKTAGINLLIAEIAVTGLGQYSLAYQATSAPLSLLNGAVSQVLLQRLSTTERGGMVKLLRASFGRIFIFSAPVFALFYFAAPSLFPFVFGGQWAEAGQIAQALVPWLFMLTFTSPLSSLFIIVEKQEWALAFAAVSTAAAVGFLALTPLDLLAAVTWLALIMAAVLVLWVGMALLVARDFDADSHKRGLGLGV